MYVAFLFCFCFVLADEKKVYLQFPAIYDIYIERNGSDLITVSIERQTL